MHPALTKELTFFVDVFFTSDRDYLKWEIFETFHVDSLRWALDFHTSFSNLDTFSRSQQRLNAMMKTVFQVRRHQFSERDIKVYIKKICLCVPVAEIWKPLSRDLRSNGHCLVPVEENLVDLIWEDRPPPPTSAMIVLPKQYTGNIPPTPSLLIHR